MRLAIDLGTAYTKLVAASPDGTTTRIALQDATADGSLPTAIALRDDGEVAIGQAAYGEPNHLYERFVPLLERGAGSSPPVGWPPERTPLGVLRAYLSRVVAEASQDAPIEQVVVAVPERWKIRSGSADADPADAVERVLRGPEFGIEQVRTVGQATAAAAYLRQVSSAARACDRLLVCDCGVGAFQVTLLGGTCRIETATATVPESDWPLVCPLDLDEAMARYGLARANGRRPVPGEPELVIRRQALERARRRADQDRLAMVITDAMGASAESPLYLTPVYRYGSQPVPVGELLSCYRPVEAVVTATVRDLVARRTDLRGTRPWQVAIVGGGAATRVLLPSAILRALSIHDKDGHSRVLPIAGPDLTWLPALGAGLIAAGVVEPGDVYPHEVRLRASRIEGGLLRRADLRLAPAGALVAGAATPVVATADGQRVWIDFQRGDDRPVTLDIHVGSGEVISVPIPPDARPPAGSYQVGIRLVDDGCLLECLPASGRPWVYQLGPLPASHTDDSGMYTSEEGE